MCGFLVEYRKENLTFKKNLFLSSSLKIKHRGPDSHGSIFLKNFSAKFFRLRILELSKKGDQPMISKNKRFVILFNGEIYNYKSLRKSYNLKTNTDSDTEVILLLFEKLGPSMVNKLEGMFSIMIYDNIKNCCHFFRDRFGIKPLYYIQLADKILFSSEIKPLLNYTEKIINKKTVLEFFLKQSMDHSEQTLFKNIQSILPASFGTLNENGIKIKKYWNFSKLKKTKSILITKKKIDELLTASIKSHLVSDRKLGFFFSGGTDSLSIVSKAKLYEKNPNLFTYKFLSKNGDVYGEHKKAKIIANELGLKLDVITVTPELIIKNFDKVIDACEAPITSIRQIADYLLFKKFKEKNIPVAIIGHGGDELLGGYDYNFLHYLKDKYKKKHKVNNFIYELLKYINAKSKPKSEIKNIIMNYLITFSFQEGSNKDCTPFVEIDNFSKKLLNEYLTDDFYRSKINKKFNFLQNSQLKDIFYVSLPRNLRCCDRLSMAHGVEARVPLLDHKLANFLFNINNEYKFKNYETRWIYKSLFSKKITKYFSVHKNSVPDPQSEWLKSDLKEFFMDEFLSLSFKNNEMFDKKKILKNLDLFHKNKLRSSFHLFQIFTFQKFKNHFNI